MLNESEQSPVISWSAFSASVVEKVFQESSKSPMMIKHGMDVIKTAVDKVRKDQTPGIVFGQPLYASAKKVQRSWKDIYSETQFVVIMGPLHTEMAALKTLGD